MKYLICMDESTFAANSFEFASKLIQEKDEVIIITVLYAKLSDEDEKQRQIDIRAYQKQFLDRLNERKISSKGLVSVGDAREIIVRTATDSKVDIIVTGSRGLSKLKRLVISSTSDYICHNFQGNVLVVRPKPEEDIKDEHSPTADKSSTPSKYNETVNTVSSKLDETKDKFEEGTSSKWDKTKDKFNETKDKVAEETSSKWDETKDKFEELKDKVEEETSSKWDETKDKFNETKDKVEEETSSKWDETKDKFGELKDKVVKKFDETFYPEGTTATKNDDKLADN